MKMKKAIKEYSTLSIDDVRRIRGYSYSVLRRSIKKIPTCSGVYIWRYWPNIPSLDSNKLIGFIADLQKNFPQQMEQLKNSRIDVTVKRTPFGGDEDGRFLGITSEEKIKRLTNLLDKDESTRQAFAHTIEMLISSFPPIYIGKANNLRERLSDHFDNKTELLPRLVDGGIPVDDIYISFIRDNLSQEDEEVTTSIEEILQRLTNPAHTKRYG